MGMKIILNGRQYVVQSDKLLVYNISYSGWMQGKCSQDAVLLMMLTCDWSRDHNTGL